MRAFDITVSLACLIFLFPILSLVAFWIECVSRGPVFYTQERIGKDGKIFTVYKFRTMPPDAEATTGPIWARKNDPRLIKGGKFFKDTHLDEVPQFFNVLKGNMAVVGPRPERPMLAEQFVRAIPGYNDRVKVKPGVAGLSQITYDYDKDIEDVERKVKKDLEYAEHRSLLLDMKILFNTFLVVITGRLHPVKVRPKQKMTRSANGSEG